MDLILYTPLFCSFAIFANALPVVDKGVFVITGVKTCRDGYGYCILGSDCTVDKEFVPDSDSGHCEGLKKAFTPRAFFVCCMSIDNSTLVTSTTTTTTTTAGPPSLEEDDENNSSSNASNNSDAESNSVESVEAVTAAPLESVQTEISVVVEMHSHNESKTPEVKVTQTCGLKAQVYNTPLSEINRVDASRLAAQETSLVCWTGAIVRSPSSLTLQDPGSFICTGALISEDYLVTTATCVSRLFAQDLSLFKVALGSRHLVHPMNGVTPDATYKDIVKLIVHQDYNVQGMFKRVNDIALVKLAPSNDIRSGSSKNSYCTVCLPGEDEEVDTNECIVTGYSHPTNTIDSTVNVPSAHDTDGILHEAEQRIEFASSCEIQLTNFTVAQNTVLRNDLNLEQSKLLCASGKFNAEACFSPRDAGSPLACNGGDSFKLVGVFSSGFHCGTTSSPVLYTQVNKFVPWINQNIVD